MSKPWGCTGVVRSASPGVDRVNTLGVNFKFAGQGQRPTPVSDARGIVRIIMLLPCRAAAPIRAKAADVLVRYMGGDPSLIPEITENRSVQERLPDIHPARLFGETVECESRVPTAPLEFREAPHLEGAAHLYALGSAAHPRLYKTGSGKNPYDRLDREEKKHGRRLQLYLVAIWYNEGHLEHLARRHLKELPPSELGVIGTEYRMTTHVEIKDATDAARQQLRGLGGTYEEEHAFKRRRVEIQLRNSELELAKAEFELQKAKDTHEMDMAYRACELEERKAALSSRV